jgi:hypothetical protein
MAFDKGRRADTGQSKRTKRGTKGKGVIAPQVVAETDTPLDPDITEDEDVSDLESGPTASGSLAGLSFTQVQDCLMAGATVEQITQLGASGFTPDQIVSLASSTASSGGITAEGLAEAMKAAREKIPENIKAPLISDANPLGERDHPRPLLKCAMYFGGALIGNTKVNAGLTLDEIDSLNQVTPGHYRITKTDGSRQVIEVEGRLNSNLETELLRFVLPEGDQTKNNYPGQADLARQCCSKNRVTPLVAS